MPVQFVQGMRQERVEEGIVRRDLLRRETQDMMIIEIRIRESDAEKLSYTGITHVVGSLHYGHGGLELDVEGGQGSAA